MSNYIMRTTRKSLIPTAQADDYVKMTDWMRPIPTIKAFHALLCEGRKALFARNDGRQATTQRIYFFTTFLPLMT